MNLKIQFDKIDLTTIPQFYGGEKETKAFMHIDSDNKIMKGFLEPGASIGMHSHHTSSEIIFITSGKGRAVCEGETEFLSEGDCHYCRKGQCHSLINDGDNVLTFLAVVAEQ